MLHVNLDILLSINAGLLAAGGVCLILYAGWLVRSGYWRDPLADVAHVDGPPLWAAVLVWLGPMVLAFLAIKPERLVEPGSADWHKANIIYDVAKLIFAAVGLSILARHARAHTDPFANVGRTGTPMTTWRLLPYLVPATLISLAVSTTQLRMCRYVWSWFAPAAEQPTHVVLVALEHSVWGGWGALQLTIAAVIIAPLFEEVVFRGLLLTGLAKLVDNPWPPILISALAFGFIHFTQPQDVLPLVTFGVVLGFLRLRTGRLWFCIAVHGLFNLRTMTLALLNPDVLRADW